MPPAELSLDRAPPLSVPLRFFLAAPAFGVLAGLLLAWIGPGAFVSRWAPPTIALTHLVTLGFVTMVAVGALFQMLPVLAGASAPAPRLLAGTVHPLLVLGTLGLAGGFLFGPFAREVLRAGGALLAAALVVFLAAVGRSLVHAGAGVNPTVRGMAFALLGLAVAAALGLARAAAYAWGLGIPASLAGVHLAWALLGWVGILIVAVSFQVVPMFQITPEYPAWMVRWLPPGLWLTLVLWSGAALAGSPWMQAVATALLATGFCAFAAATLRLQQRRRRRRSDAFVWCWRIAMAAVFAAAALALLRYLPAAAGRVDEALGAMILVGAAQTVMFGMLYKIVPFLVWLHSRARPGGVHNMNQVLPPGSAGLQLWLHGIALVLILAACAAPGLSRIAGVAYAGSCAFLGFNLMRALGAYRRAGEATRGSTT